VVKILLGSSAAVWESDEKERRSKPSSTGTSPQIYRREREGVWVGSKVGR
jgi:hypothetical protein